MEKILGKGYSPKVIKYEKVPAAGDDVYKLTMEKVGDKNLWQAFVDGTIDSNMWQDIGNQIVRMVQKLGKNGFAHGDIKPDNFMFALEGGKPRVWIIDPVGFPKNFPTSSLGQYIKKDMDDVVEMLRRIHDAIEGGYFP